MSSVLAGGGSGGAPSQKLALAMALSPTAATAIPRLVSLREKLDNLEQKMTVPSLTRNTRFGGFKQMGGMGHCQSLLECGAAFSRKPG